jgi:hypothetical protein
VLKSVKRFATGYRRRACNTHKRERKYEFTLTNNKIFHGCIFTFTL